MPKIRNVYEISVEESGDYIFTPTGVVIVLENGQFSVYSESARHNFLRRALMRYPWDQMLYESAEEQDISVRLRDMTEEIAKKIGTGPWGTDAILQTCYDMNPRQLFFLQRYSTSPSQTNMPPR